MDIVESAYTTLRTIGKDERWLHKWIREKPSRLGLGELVIECSELSHYKNMGGRLDILAYRADLDTYYEIEVMLGECDADHGFRTLDYWARERLRNPNSRHVAVLVAEDLSGCYQTDIETLSQFLPFIGVEIKVLRLPYQDGVATIVTSVVAQPDDLVIDAGYEPGKTEQTATSPKDRAWWKSKCEGPILGHGGRDHQVLHPRHRTLARGLFGPELRFPQEGPARLVADVAPRQRRLRLPSGWGRRLGRRTIRLLQPSACETRGHRPRVTDLDVQVQQWGQPDRLRDSAREGHALGYPRDPHRRLRISLTANPNRLGVRSAKFYYRDISINSPGFRLFFLRCICSPGEEFVSRAVQVSTGPWRGSYL